MKLIKLSRRLFALVDDRDYDKLLPYKWSVKPARDGRVYAVTNVRTAFGWRQQSMSTMLMNPPPGQVVLFKNHWGLDCRRRNLLVVPRGKVTRFHRVRRDSASRMKGISLENDGQYSALIQIDGVPERVGTFETAEEAMAAYDGAIKRHFGTMASVHKPGKDGVSARRRLMRPVPPPTRKRHRKEHAIMDDLDQEWTAASEGPGRHSI